MYTVNVQIDIKEINETLERIAKLKGELEKEADKLSRQSFDMVKVIIKE